VLGTSRRSPTSAAGAREALTALVRLLARQDRSRIRHLGVHGPAPAEFFRMKARYQADNGGLGDNVPAVDRLPQSNQSVSQALARPCPCMMSEQSHGD